MAMKKKVVKFLGNLSQDELYEARNCIDTLISNQGEPAIKPHKGKQKTADAFSDMMRQERFYHIFTCKFKKVNELKKPASIGTVVDISKSGLRLKTKNNHITVGNLLVIFPGKKAEASILAISPEYDHDGNKIFAEVTRVKELLEMSELGCKFLPRKSLLFDLVV
jgi:hypothetical protein